MPKKLTQSSYIKSVVEVHGSRYDLSKVEYNGMRSKVKVICNTHGLFIIGAREMFRGGGCQKCERDYDIGKMISYTLKSH